MLAQIPSCSLIPNIAEQHTNILGIGQLFCNKFGVYSGLYIRIDAVVSLKSSNFGRLFSVQRLGRITALFIVTSCVFVSLGAFFLKHWSEQSFKLSDTQIVYFPQGTKLEDLSGALDSGNVVSEGFLFALYVRFFENYSRFQAGRYSFSGDVRPVDVVNKIARGEVERRVIAQFTIPEGFTLEKTIARLTAKNFGSREKIREVFLSKKYREKWGIKAISLEGFLYPATYSFYKRPSPEEVLDKVLKTFFSQVTPDLIKQFKKKGLSLRKALTFASLIELETLHDDEKSKVAEVIWRRLKAGEPLGIDAALIYGIEGYNGDITWAHLRDRKNRYNTRIHKGLPPGPIGSPSLSSLQAILRPTNEGYYYYVLVADGKQRHHFSKSFAEHKKHVQRLKKAQRKH